MVFFIKNYMCWIRIYMKYSLRSPTAPLILQLLMIHFFDFNALFHQAGYAEGGGKGYPLLPTLVFGISENSYFSFLFLFFLISSSPQKPYKKRGGARNMGVECRS